MSSNITRRDVLRLAGGSLLGIMFTPVPWKLLDDTAIWTQNWRLTPNLPRGPVTIRYSACTLCPGGCGLKARCINGLPYALTATPRHPIGRGALCPVGLAAHHLSFHPLRLRGPHAFTAKGNEGKLTPLPLADALRQITAALAACQAGEHVAVLDQQPGRHISAAYRQFISRLNGGIYIRPPSQESATVETLAGLLDGPVGPLGLDYENASVIMSFGAPLVDGWGTYGRMASLLGRREHAAPFLFHAESHRSRTAGASDQWLPIQVGSEAALALGIAHVIVRECLYRPSILSRAKDFPAYRTLVSSFPPEKVAELTGLQEEAITQTARRLASAGPSLVLAGPDPAGGPLKHEAQLAIAGLNLLLGNCFRPGGILQRRSGLPPPTAATPLADVPENSIRLLIIDGADSGYAFPWELLRQRLLPEGALVVSLSPYLAGLAPHADIVLPSPAHLETLQDIPAPWDAITDSYALSIPLIPPPADAVDPRSLLRHMTKSVNGPPESIRPLAEEVEERTERIFTSKRGTLFDPASGVATAVPAIASSSDLRAALEKGHTWTDDPLPQSRPSTFHFLGTTSPAQMSEAALAPRTRANALLLQVAGRKGQLSSGSMSPIMSKVYQESALEEGHGVLTIHPSTARAQGFNDGDTVTVRTARGTARFTLRSDSAVIPGVIRACSGPLPNGESDPRGGELAYSLCEVDPRGFWHDTDATLERT